MAVEVCKKCGRMFNYGGYGGVYCGACKKEDIDNFDKIRTYIREHGASNMYELTLATGVEEKEIRRYLRESRLEIPDNSDFFIKCEVCGCDIKSGRYCPSCAANLSKDLQSALVEVGEKPKTKGDAKMRFIGKDFGGRSKR